MKKTASEMKIGRRLFLTITGALALIAITKNFSYVLELSRRLQGRLMKPEKPLPLSKRTVADLTSETKSISLELALNSRCTSDYNGNQKIFHWGLFDPEKKLKQEDIQRVVDQVHIPRFTDGKLQIKTEENVLYFLMEDEADEVKRSWMMIESGMQQQLACLICAAFGIGMVFKGLGKDGTKYSDSMHGNTRIILNPMKPSYNGSFWCNASPEGLRPWLNGNLTPPSRNGKTGLIELISTSIQNSSFEKKESTNFDISQLLWAARGRTPHYYKSKPWGMTIPVCGGAQNLTSMYLCHSGNIFRYSNWMQGRPTHTIDVVTAKKSQLKFGIAGDAPPPNCHLLLSRNEKTGRALWEIGYQLLNIVLQAAALNITISPNLMDDYKRNKFDDNGIKDTWAEISLHVDAFSI